MDVLKAVIISCEDADYAIAIDFVISIDQLVHVNRIPQLPEYVLGLMRVRGELTPILDMRKIFYDQMTSLTTDTTVVVVQGEKIQIGLVVEDAKEILDLPNDLLTNQALSAYSKIPYFTTVANLESRMITVLDPMILSSTLMGMEQVIDYVEAQTIEEGH